MAVIREVSARGARHGLGLVLVHRGEVSGGYEVAGAHEREGQHGADEGDHGGDHGNRRERSGEPHAIGVIQGRARGRGE